VNVERRLEPPGNRSLGAGSSRVAVLSPLLLGACGNLPAALDAHGSNAQQTAQIAWILIVGAAVILVFVIALATYAAFATNANRTLLGGNRFVVGAGIIFPIITLSALLVYTFTVWGALSSESGVAPVRIEISGEMWWWRIRYVDANGAFLFSTANEIHIPVGRPVEISLRSADVLHSFWAPQLAGKLDMIPGRVNVLKLRAESPGVFRGQCAEYCGAQHAKMAFYVVAEGAAEFEAWLAAQGRPVQMPSTPEQEQGRELFFMHCGVCHTARGTTAAGELGPDLTHVGSRLFIAAGTLPNNAGTLAGWVAASQHIKPGNRMPSFDDFSGRELTALAAYVESLR
jgi:cytochrome c oxidase subunit II